MIPHAAAARGPSITSLIHAAARKLSDRAHARCDDHARALGWQVTETPGPLGLTGRRYHDPRFAARTGQRPATTGTRSTR